MAAEEGGPVVHQERPPELLRRQELQVEPGSALERRRHRRVEEDRDRHRRTGGRHDHARVEARVRVTQQDLDGAPLNVDLPVDHPGDRVPLLGGRVQADGAAGRDPHLVEDQLDARSLLVEEHAVVLVVEDEDVRSRPLEVLVLVQPPGLAFRPRWRRTEQAGDRRDDRGGSRRLCRDGQLAPCAGRLPIHDPPPAIDSMSAGFTAGADVEDQWLRWWMIPGYRAAICSTLPRPRTRASNARPKSPPAWVTLNSSSLRPATSDSSTSSSPRFRPRRTSWAKTRLPFRNTASPSSLPIPRWSVVGRSACSTTRA